MSGHPPHADAGPIPAMERAVAAAELGLGSRLDPNGTRDLVARVESDPDARVRVAALGALARAAPKVSARAAWRRATADRDPAVRRRCCELAPVLDTRATRATMIERVLVLLDDDDALVAEAAAFALGELGSRRGAALMSTALMNTALMNTALTRAATDHSDPLVREAAVAALGAIGDPASLPAVLAATHDRPAIRRRAVLALAAFDGPEVDAAIAAALSDTDWQVRQAAEDLTR